MKAGIRRVYQSVGCPDYHPFSPVVSDFPAVECRVPHVRDIPASGLIQRCAVGEVEEPADIVLRIAQLARAHVSGGTVLLNESEEGLFRQVVLLGAKLLGGSPNMALNCLTAVRIGPTRARVSRWRSIADCKTS